MTLQAVRRISYDSGPNMTPLVDVVMVILIFLMLAGSFVGQILPAGSVNPLPPDISIDKAIGSMPIPICIDRGDGGNMVLLVANRQVQGRDNLKTQLVSMREQLNSAGRETEDIPIQLSPSRKISYEMLVVVHDAAREAGFSKIGIGKAR